MLNWLVRTALRQRVAVVAAAVVLLVIGGRSLRNTSLDVFPEFAPPRVEVQTEVPGLSTAQVESLVTVPIENALTGVSWLISMRSNSVLGLSSVVLIFEPGTDLMLARQQVQERLGTLMSQLPLVASPPVILSPLSSLSRVLKIGMSSGSLSQMELTTLARWTVRPRLMAVPGVANVAIWGQRDRQIQVQVDPEQLETLGLSLGEIEAAVRGATALGAGGFLDTPNQRLPITHVASISSPEDLAAVSAAYREGVPLSLGSATTIVEGHPPPIGDAVINDRPGLLLIVEKQPWGNTLEVTREVEAAMESLRPGLAGVDIDTTIFRPATFIDMALSNLWRAMLVGSLLVIVILGLFLFEWRSALISLTAIPLSLVAAVLVLLWRGETINTMVLAGLLIALGEVVDDAIIDVENIIRRLRLNTEAGSPRPVFNVVLDASIEVRSAIIYASLIVVVVFLPVMLLPGVAGAFFRPLALSYVLAILASLLVALTLTPALSLMLLPGSAGRTEAPLVRWLKARFRRMMPPLIRNPRWILAGASVPVLLSLAVFPFLGQEFLPRFKEYDFLMHWVGKPGTSLEAMRRITLRVSEELRAIPGVRNFGSHIGRAEVADEVVGPNFAELWISLDPQEDHDTAVRRIQEVVDGYPGLYRDVLTYLKERIKEVLTGGSGSLIVRIYGPDLEVLRNKAREVAAVLERIEGVTDLHVEQQVLVPQVEISTRVAAAAAVGLSPGDIRHAAATLVQGSKAGEIYGPQGVIDVVVRGRDGLVTDLGALRRLRLDTPLGTTVPLASVADVRIMPSPGSIRREAGSRRIDVSCNARGRDLGSVAREIRRQVLGLEFSREYHPEFLGEYAARAEAQNRLLLLALLSVVIIFLLLHAEFRSFRLALLVFLGLPFALMGGVAVILMSGATVSLGTLVGMVSVLGIAARNGIMLVSHYRHLEAMEGLQPGSALVIRGTEERLAPILMTAMTTALALLPLAVSGYKPGHEIEHPMALVILGGLVTSTLLNLFVMPSLYLRFGPRQLAAGPAAEEV